MKSVGLITYYGNNYGGILQAYALQQVVEGFGYDCKLISNDFLYQKRSLNRIRALMVNFRVALKNPVAYMKKRRVYKSFSKQIAQNARVFDAFRQEQLLIDNTCYTSYAEYVNSPPLYDVYLCGSDQIWNPNLYSDNGFYFADFAPENALKVSYSSSMGVSILTEKQVNFIAPLLRKIKIISTREQSCADLIRKISNKDARVVLDPTLLLDGDKWSSMASARLIKEPYVFCYLFGERTYYEQVKKQIKETTGMKIVCIPFVARELSSDDEKVFDAGPADFVSLIKNASLVLTDSFHATAFSINLKTPFLSLYRFEKNDKKSMNDRLVSILNIVGLSDRLIDEGDFISSETLIDMDFENAHAILDLKREEDREFLCLELDGKDGVYNENM